MSFMHKVFNAKQHKIYLPEYPEKYAGKQPIIARSNWEYKFCRWLDLNPNILRWASEPIKINYYDPVTKKKRGYYPDFLFVARNKEDLISKHLIEIKPHKQAVKPRNSKKKLRSQLIEEQMLYMRNQAKWIAANAWCQQHDISFNILTEQELFK